MSQLALSDTEWLVLNELWKNHPLTAREVHAQLESSTGWAYTTVKTILDRMVTKKLVACHKANRLNSYQPLIAQQAAQSSATKQLLNKAFSGSLQPLVHCLLDEKKISENDKQEILDILNKGLNNE